MKPRYRSLVIVVAVMILLFLIGGWFGFRTNSSDPRTTVMAFDTNTVVLIEFVDLADARNNVQLMRIGSGWERMSERIVDVPPSEHASELLRTFHELPVKRDMGMIGLVGERFDLTRNTMGRISFIQADGVTHSLYLGRSTFAPGREGSWTYVNLPNDKIVYAVEGLLMARLRPGTDSL